MSTTDSQTKGYHLSNLTKGEVGEISKIREELEELEDAARQDCKIMELVELSDLYGAIELYLQKHHPNISMTDLQVMNKITQRAFVNGFR